jgi:hypothetical protein
LADKTGIGQRMIYHYENHVSELPFSAAVPPALRTSAGERHVLITHGAAVYIFIQAKGAARL